MTSGCNLCCIFCFSGRFYIYALFNYSIWSISVLSGFCGVCFATTRMSFLINLCSFSVWQHRREQQRTVAPGLHRVRAALGVVGVERGAAREVNNASSPRPLATLHPLDTPQLVNRPGHPTSRHSRVAWSVILFLICL